MALILPLAILAAALARALRRPRGRARLRSRPRQFRARGLRRGVDSLARADGRPARRPCRRRARDRRRRDLGGADHRPDRVYAYRFELSDIADRVMAEFIPGEAQVGRGGEVIVNRRLGGEFVIPAKVNDLPVPSSSTPAPRP